MATSPMYILQLRRMVERLRDPYPLHSTEQKKLAALLPSVEEQDDVKRRWREIKRGREFMVVPTDHPGRDYHERREQLTQSLRDAIHMAKRDTSISLKRIAKYEAQIRVIKSRDYQDPSILREAQGELDRWVKLRDGYVDSVRCSWEATPEDVRKRFFDHKGSFTLDNLPTQHGNPERWFYPDEPVSERLAYIEVLEAKIERLSSST